MNTNRRILTIQQRAREVGRIRLGDQVEFTRNDGTTGSRPHRLDRFRFTSSSKETLEIVAAAKGGTVRPWEGAPVAEAYELYSDAKSLPIAIPHGMDVVSQQYEDWDAGGCKRRCDGEREWITDQPCLCDPADRTCKMVTRVSVLLPDVPVIGLWRLDTGSYYAGTEFVGQLDLMAAIPWHVRATLRLEQRKVVREGQTRQFAIPVLDIVSEEVMAAIVTGPDGGRLPAAVVPTAATATTPVLPKPTRPELPPGPDPEPLSTKADVVDEPESAPPPAPPPVDLDAAVQHEQDMIAEAIELFDATVEPMPDEAAEEAVDEGSADDSTSAAPDTPEAPPTAQEGPAPGDPVTQDQLRELFARVKAKDWSAELLRAVMAEVVPNVEKSADMTQAQFVLLRDEVERRIAKSESIKGAA